MPGMIRTSRRIGAGVALLTLVSTIGVSPLDVPGVAALGATVDCTPTTGTPADHAPLESYTPITPVRLIDTRDGTGGVAGAIGAGCTMTIDLAGSPVPSDAEAVAFSVTAIAPQRGFLTVFACEEGRPPTSNLNTRPGVPTPNLVVSAIGAQIKRGRKTSGPFSYAGVAEQHTHRSLTPRPWQGIVGANPTARKFLCGYSLDFF